MRLDPEKWGDDNYWVNKNKLQLPIESDPQYSTSTYAMPKSMEGPTDGPQYDGLAGGLSQNPINAIHGISTELTINQDNVKIYSHATDDIKKLEDQGLSEPAAKVDMPMEVDETLGSEIKNPLPSSLQNPLQEEL